MKNNTLNLFGHQINDDEKPKRKSKTYHRTIDDNDLNEIDLVFPVCLKTYDQRTYFRYFIDGKRELITIHENTISFTFGIAPDLHLSQSKNDFIWLKVLMTRQHVISQDEYMEKFNEAVHNGYETFINAQLFEMPQLKVEPEINSNQKVIVWDKSIPDPF